MHFVYFVVLVGVLVFIHELGHFAWAKFFGVRVLTFSLGFGPRIAGFHRGGTEYVVSALPLGGYVRMLGDNPRDEIHPGDEGKSFAQQSIFRRTVITVAGPAMNLLFPIVLYFIVFLGDTQLSPASLGMVFPNRPGYGILEPGDRVTSIDGEEVHTFYDLTRIVERSAGKTLRFEIDRDGEHMEAEVTPVWAYKEHPLDLVRRVGRVGIQPHHPIAVVGVTTQASAAGAARMATFDVVVAAGGVPVTRWIDLERAMAHNQGSMVPVTYLRPVPVKGALGGLVELDVYEPRVATLTPEPGEGTGPQRAGLESSDLYVSDVKAGSPEHRAGLLPGDRLLTLDSRPITLWATFMQDLRKGRGAVHEIEWRRGDEVFTARFALEHQRGVDEHGQEVDAYTSGIRHWVPTRIDPLVDNPHPIRYAMREALAATAEMVELTVFSVVRLLQGRLSVKTIGGPLTIFRVAGVAAREGALNYLALMAFISINLGLINLLPIPLLDGGHLMFFLFEAVARRPPSLRVREYAHIAGFALLVSVMVLAFKNDIERQWPRIVDQIAGE